MEKVITNADTIVLLDNSVTADEESKAYTRGEYLKHFIQVVKGGGSPTVQVQVSGDGETWFSLGSAISANGYATIEGFYPWISVKRNNSTDPVTVKLFSGWCPPR